MTHVSANRADKMPVLVIPLIKHIKPILKGCGALQCFQVVGISFREANLIGFEFLVQKPQQTAPCSLFFNCSRSGVWDT